MLQTIAPAPGKNSTKTTVLGMNSVNLQTTQLQQQSINQNSGYIKKKFTYANMPFGQQPISVARRNARERNRVKQVNNGFVTLRQHIPQNIIQALSNGGRGPHKKLSKVDTLRLAVEYIRRLQDIVSDIDGKSPQSSSTILSDFSNSSFDQMIASPNSETSSYYTASPEPLISSPSPHQQQQHQQHHHHLHQIYSNSTSSLLLHNTSIESQNQSEASISPAPSYISESSSLSPSSIPNQYGYNLNSKINLTPLTTIVTAGSTITGTTTANLNYSLNQFKYEPYDDYSPINHQSHNNHQQHHSTIVETATTSEDEELLDYISMWQEEQQQQQQQQQHHHQ